MIDEVVERTRTGLWSLLLDPVLFIFYFLIFVLFALPTLQGDLGPILYELFLKFSYLSIAAMIVFQVIVRLDLANKTSISGWLLYVVELFCVFILLYSVFFLLFIDVLGIINAIFGLIFEKYGFAYAFVASMLVMCALLSLADRQDRKKSIRR